MDGAVIIMDYSSYERQKIRHILDKTGSFDFVEVTSFNQIKQLDFQINNLMLVIMDITFPTELEGFEVLKMLHNNKYTSHIPIIVATKLDKPEKKAEALKYSVKDYIIKPYQVKRLESSIRSLIQIQENFHYDTAGIENIILTFDDYVSKEIKYSERTQSPVSFILISTLKIKIENDQYSKIEIDNKEAVFSIAAENARNSLRLTDTIVFSKDRDIIIILPCTPEEGAKEVCEKIKSQLINELEKLSVNQKDYIYPVHVTYPTDGEDFQELMESAFKKVSNKEMLEKIVSIPENTRKYADKTYNRYNKWF